MNCDYEALMRQIQAVSFAVDDITLYLDTHPNDSAAMALYQSMRAQRQQAVDQFNTTFGPLTPDDVLGDRWTWPQLPWPWETEV